MIKTNKLLKVIILLFGIILFNNLVSAVECGSTPTDGCTVSVSTNFTAGNYSLPNGISIVSDGITLDCKGSTLTGTNTGINAGGRDNLLIQNCRLENYGTSLYLRYTGSCPFSINPTNNNKIINNTFYNSTSYGVYLGGGLCNNPTGEYFPSNNYFADNLFLKNSKGAFIFNSRISNFTRNNFVNNTVYGIHLSNDAHDLVIYNNSFYNTSIRYDETNNNKYCLNGQYPNNYFNGAVGPLCECILPQDQFKVTSNEVFCQGNYSIPNGFTISGAVALNCNNSILTGSGNKGIDLGSSNNANISSCIMENYSSGFYMSYAGQCNAPLSTSGSNFIYNNILRNNNYGFELKGAYCNTVISFGLHSIDNNKIINNTIINNTRGISGIYTRSNNISLNNLEDNDYGFYFEKDGVSDNKIYYNNFIQNNISSKVLALNYNWNISRNGNYWDDYDSSVEGCNNADFDQFCDLPYNVSGGNLTDYFPYIVQDGWLLGPQAGEPMPVQVIADVDMVKGKTTLIRIPVTFTSVLSNDTITPNVTVYWNGSFVGQNLTTSFTYNQSKNVDFWYVPQNAGNNLPLEVRVTGTSTNGLNYTESNIKNVDVVETRDLSLFFTSINNADLSTVTNRQSEFLESTYPLRNNGVIETLDGDSIQTVGNNPSTFDLLAIRYAILNRVFLSGQQFTNAIGIVPEGYLSNLDSTGINFRLGEPDVILVDESQLKTVSHEVGHTFELCDEYDSNEWGDQNGDLPNGCPNGDLDNNEVLDSICLNNSGCQTSTFPQLYSNYGIINESTNLRNIMGSSDKPNFGTSPTSNFESWISKDSYDALLDRLEVNSSFKTPIITYINHPFAYIITRIAFESDNSFTILDSYQLNGGFVNNASLGLGNYTLQILDNSNNIISNMSFQPNFVISTENGTSIQTNESFVILALPINQSFSKIRIRNTTSLLQEINKSANNPIININNLASNFSNQLINVSWNSSDLDGDSLNHTVILLRKDDGVNITVGFDISDNFLVINSSNLEDCNNCSLRVIATDSINSNSTLSNSFSINNDLSIKDFKVIYQNTTQRIFRFTINNTLINKTINNIFWSLNTGQIQIDSNISLNISLISSEEALVFAYYNYTSSGNYTVTARAYNAQFSERRSILVTV